MSAHVFAPAVVEAARAAGLALTLPTKVVEAAGTGISGLIAGHHVKLGRRGWVVSGLHPKTVDVDALEASSAGGMSTVFVALDGTRPGRWPSRTHCERTPRTPCARFGRRASDGS